MIWRETQVVDGRDLRRIKWLVQALFVDLDVRLDWFAFLDSWK
jgi:hypothetical protein